MSSLNVCVLASGSKGNSTYIASPNTKILIDMGMTCSYIVNKLKSLEVNPNEIDGILISHTHSDHIAGLKVFLKKYNPTLYLTEKMYLDLKNQMTISSYIIIDKEFNIKDLKITPVKTSHDASDSQGYIVENQGKTAAYITDTGYINQKNYQILTNKNVYIMESNHDITMLMEGKYPYHLKQRILGDYGHLSNHDSANYLSKFIGNETKHVFLAHLSEENNTPTLALTTLQEKLKEKNIEFDSISIAEQKERSELIEL